MFWFFQVINLLKYLRFFSDTFTLLSSISLSSMFSHIIHPLRKFDLFNCKTIWDICHKCQRLPLTALSVASFGFFLFWETFHRTRIDWIYMEISSTTILCVSCKRPHHVEDIKFQTSITVPKACRGKAQHVVRPRLSLLSFNFRWTWTFRYNLSKKTLRRWDTKLLLMAVIRGSKVAATGDVSCLILAYFSCCWPVWNSLSFAPTIASYNLI